MITHIFTINLNMLVTEVENCQFGKLYKDILKRSVEMATDTKSVRKNEESLNFFMKTLQVIFFQLEIVIKVLSSSF